MLRLRSAALFIVNAALLLTSFLCHVYYPDGDRYLPLFVVPLLCVLAPYVLTLPLIALLLVGNSMFFVFYMIIGILDVADVLVMTALILASTGISYFVMMMKERKGEEEKFSVGRKQRAYDMIVKELESVERKGRIVEREFGRISRLYEITKQLSPALKFDDLLSAVFDFLENNFKFQKAHLLIFNEEGEFTQGFSKSMSETDHGGEAGGIGAINYRALVDYMRNREFKQCFLERQDEEKLFKAVGVKSDTFFVFPLCVENISTMLVIEGANKLAYNRFGIVVPQIALELRKVELYERVEELSIVDGLTGVHLRRYLMDRLEEEVDRAKRLGLTFSVGMVDIDNFKKCNDTYGHLVGDVVLKEVADRLKLSMREVDMIARYGGEEFCVVLPETTKELAVTVAERLRTAVAAKKIKAFDEEIQITVSAGIATYPANGDDVTSLIESADTALYKAKRKGRNRVVAA